MIFSNISGGKKIGRFAAEIAHLSEFPDFFGRFAAEKWLVRRPLRGRKTAHLSEFLGTVVEIDLLI